jgi:hypothetical protein
MQPDLKPKEPVEWVAAIAFVGAVVGCWGGLFVIFVWAVFD